MDLCRTVIDIKVLVAHCNVNNLNYTKTLKLKVDFKVENKIYIQITRKLAHSKEEKKQILNKKVSIDLISPCQRQKLFHRFYG